MIAKMAGAKPKVAVIGAGPGGIAMGIQLADGGYDFTIYDRGKGFGGTWRNNTYPGAACDVPSHFYSYSFALNPRWSKTFANQPEILGYLEKVAADNQLGDHLVTCTRVTTLRWSDTERSWHLETEHGVTRQFDAVVTAVGMLDVPNIPDVPGAERFRGRRFHSSSWDHTKSTAGSPTVGWRCTARSTPTVRCSVCRRAGEPVLPNDDVANGQQDHGRHGHERQHLKEFGHYAPVPDSCTTGEAGPIWSYTRHHVISWVVAQISPRASRSSASSSAPARPSSLWRWANDTGSW